MAPAGNHRKDQAMCDQTFLLSNMAPQVEDHPLQLGSSSLSGGEGVQQGQVGALGAVREEAYKTLQVHRTRCQILCSMRLQCVSKIHAPCRRLKKSLSIPKINCWNNSFQNKYDMM